MTSSTETINLGVIGAGWIGTFHAETVAQRIPGARLLAVADPVPGAAEQLAEKYGALTYTDTADLLANPDVNGVVIASPAFTHTETVIAAAEAGKAVFVEKPMALTLEDADRAIEAVKTAGVPLQVGFNRRYSTDFARAGEYVHDGKIGTPQLLRSLTRDPGLAHPERVKPWTIFYETLIHDFDTLNWINKDARPAEVFAVADALVAPEYKDGGLLDTAVVTIRYDNGAIATAEANFSAAYGYDVRGEYFGSAGMVTAGNPATISTRYYSAEGVAADTSRLNIDLFHQAYTDELIDFVAAIRTGEVKGARGEDAKAALAIALACIQSCENNAPVAL